LNQVETWFEDWFWKRPWPSVPFLGALAAAQIVTVGLVILPPAQAFFHHGSLSLPELLGIGAYSIAYLVVADLLHTTYHHMQANLSGLQARRRRDQRSARKAPQGLPVGKRRRNRPRAIEVC
jgi:hypothetical protein